MLQWMHRLLRSTLSTTAYIKPLTCIPFSLRVWYAHALTQQSTVLGLTTTLCQQREHRATFSPRRGQYGRFLTGDAPKESSSGAEA